MFYLYIRNIETGHELGFKSNQWEKLMKHKISIKDWDINDTNVKFIFSNYPPISIEKDPLWKEIE
jgi:hypothetical protein